MECKKWPDSFLTFLSVKPEATILKVFKTGSWLYLEIGWRHEFNSMKRIWLMILFLKSPNLPQKTKQRVIQTDMCTTAVARLTFPCQEKGLLEDVLLLKVYGTLLELEWHSVEFRPPVCILAHLKRLIFANNIHLFLEKSIKCLANSLSHNAKERETHREKSPESVNIVYSGIIGIIEKINISPFCEGPLKAPQRPKGISRMTSELSDGKWQCILLTAIMLI